MIGNTGVGVALYDARAMFSAFLAPVRALLGR